jgi:hypothetical protein
MLEKCLRSGDIQMVLQSKGSVAHLKNGSLVEKLAWNIVATRL